MRRFFMIVLVLLLTLMGCAPEETNRLGIKKPNDENITKATVERVIDGDTLKVRLADGKAESVRLLLVDTPETVKPDTPVQPYGNEASQFTKEALPSGTAIRLERDHSRTDRYGRVLAYVWYGDKMLNQELLRNGLARVAFVYEPDTRYVDVFEDIEQKAKEQKKNIWEIDGYVTNRGFDDQAVSDRNGEAAESCAIKGNINRSGKKIYHVPGGQSYDEVKPEQRFCTEKEAKESGFVRAAR
ncbi:thermonuclease family protein [Exiguobacterium sp. TDN 0502]|uniref:thermonuclease family protein n=1 Tax=Exiguobacterium sp. TDN 0502 TaxID=3420731 RepID=UPI003D786BD6